MDRKEIINSLKIITNLILIITLFAVLYTLVNYNQEIKEVVGDANPERLITYYENRTGLDCNCQPIDYLKDFWYTDINLTN
jgi:hypothetical protein